METVKYKRMRHGSLFSGIGGFDFAAEWMGWENVFHCEWNAFGQRILKHYWSNAKSYEDITKSDFTIWRGRIDVLTGGFPCQPFSTAGKRKGTEDSRYLWPEMLRVIREVQPRYIVGENVRGLVSWDGGLVFDTVCSDLEAEGYEVLPVLLPAASVNAPHKRDRIWFIAHANHKGGSSGLGQVQSENGEISERNNDAEFSDSDNGNASNTNNERLQGGQKINRWKKFDIERSGNGINIRTVSTNDDGYSKCNFINFPTVSPICNGDDGLSDRLDSITFPKWRNESIKAGGNAIVPQVAYQIFKTIEAYERLSNRLPAESKD
jgi:DNA (cytosine-5)-methyltransferase 1